MYLIAVVFCHCLIRHSTTRAAACCSLRCSPWARPWARCSSSTCCTGETHVRARMRLCCVHQIVMGAATRTEAACLTVVLLKNIWHAPATKPDALSFSARPLPVLKRGAARTRQASYGVVDASQTIT